ncbi:MAG: polyphosphate polymerase domain-containing protein [Muribaculaceae bacterium]|nr:polyphosphate polymerase domain-containing protein [Muribaculaceae bacterium]
MLEPIIQQFQPITLEEMSTIKLMNRTDTKFVTSVPVLCQLLKLAQGEYRAQETDGLRLSPYHTLYFDTPDCAMYVAHQNGHLNRQKLRVRSYVSSGLHFLEVKTKDNHKRTHKKRVTLTEHDKQQWPAIVQASQGQVSDFLSQRLRYDHTSLLPMLENEFNRITLVNRACTERLTIDSGLRFTNWTTHQHRVMTHLVIIELKRDGLQPSPILDMLRMLRIKPHGFSKYCMGMAFTDASLKQNRFKERMRSVERIMSQAQQHSSITQ